MKSIEQGAQEYADKKAKVYVSDTLIENTINDLNLFAKTDFKAGAEFAQQWISIKDELPEVGLKIECKNERDSYYCGVVENRDIDHFNRLIVCGMFHGSNAIDLLYNFTHWRPINLK